jgi:hypothetical protein
MLLRNKRAVVRVSADPVLNINDRKKFSAFVALLVQIDKRINANGKETNKAKLKKAKDALLEQDRKGSQPSNFTKAMKDGRREPFLLLLNTLSCILDQFTNNFKAYIYDRYSSSTSFFRYV